MKSIIFALILAGTTQASTLIVSSYNSGITTTVTREGNGLFHYEYSFDKETVTAVNLITYFDITVRPSELYNVTGAVLAPAESNHVAFSLLPNQNNITSISFDTLMHPVKTTIFESYYNENGFPRISFAFGYAPEFIPEPTISTLICGGAFFLIRRKR